MSDNTISPFEAAIAAELTKDFARAGTEGDTITLYADCQGVYGDGAQWLGVVLKKGTLVISNQTMGGDPKSNTVKSLWVLPPSVLVAPAAPAPVVQPPAPAPVVQPPAPPAAGPAPAPAPKPITTTIDASKYDQVAVESQVVGAPSQWTPDADGVVYWGLPSACVAITVAKGKTIVLDYTVLGDPDPGARKAIFRAKTIVVAPTPVPAPQPAPAPGPTNTPDVIPPLYYRPGSAQSPFKCRPVNPVLDTRPITTTVSGNKGVVSDGSYSVNVFYGPASAPSAVITGGEGDITVEHMPDGVTTPGLSNTDGKVTIVEGPDALIGYDFWLYKDKTKSDSSRVRFAMDGLLFGDSDSNPRAGTCGAGCPSIAGVIRQFHLASADDGGDTFDTALRLGLPRSTMKNGFVLPARMQDNSAAGNYGFVPEGALFMLPQNTPIDPSWSGFLQKFVRTLIKRGAYAVDVTDGNSTPFAFYVENDTVTGKKFDFWDTSWTSPAHTPSQTSDAVLRMIENNLRMVVGASAFIDDNGNSFWPTWTSLVLTPAPVATPLTIDPVSYSDIVKTWSGYHPSHIPENLLKLLSQTEPVHTAGEMTLDEGGTGYRPEIGVRSFAAQVWAITMDARARGHMLAEADLSKGTWTYHQRVVGQTDDGPPRPWHLGLDRYNDLTYDGNVVQIIPDPNEQYGLHYDTAHSPAFVFDACMLMGIEGNEAKFREYLEEQKYRVMFKVLNSPGNYSQGLKGLIVDQHRGEAWDLRDLSDLLLLLEYIPDFGFTVTDDDAKWLSSISYMVQENGKYLNGVYNTGTYVTDIPDGPGSFNPYRSFPTGARKNILGYTYWSDQGAYGYGPTGEDIILAPWQQGFHSQIIIRTARRKHRSLTAAAQQEWDDVAQFTGKWPVMIFGPFSNDPSTLDARRADRYTITVGRKSTGFFKSVAELKAANWDANGAMALSDADRNLYSHDSNNVSGGFGGSFANNVTPALSGAVMIGVPGALEAWGRMAQLVQVQAGADLSFDEAPRGVFWPDDPQPNMVPNVSGVLPAPAPSPIPAPSPTPVPAPTPVLPTNIVGKDGDPFTVTDATTIYGYGVTGTFEYFTLPKGDYSILPKSMGVPDPALNVVKRLYIMPADTKTTITSTVGAPAPQPAPAPVPTNSPTGGPVPSPAPSPAPAPSGKWISNDPIIVPAKGLFRSIPLAADMVLPDCYKDILPGAMHVNMYNWSDGCIVEGDTDDEFTIVVTGAGHESSGTMPNTQGNVCLDIKKGQPARLRWANAPLFAASTSQSTDPTGDGRVLMANGMAYNGHGYCTLNSIPRAWGLGPNLVFRWNTGVVGPLIHDISQATLGEHVLFDVMPGYGPPGSDEANQNHGYYMTTCRDDIRKGFWACEPQSGRHLMFLKPYRDADGKLRATMDYWPGIIYNTGGNLFHVESLDLLVAVGGASFRGNWAQAHGFETLRVMKPGATAADAQIFEVAYKTADGSLPPTTAPDGWYGNPREVDSFTLVSGGSGYHVGQVLDFDPNTPVPEMDGNHTPGMSTLQSYGAPLDVVVTSVDANGGITGLAFGETSYDGIEMPDNGYFWAGHGAIAEGAVIRFPLVGRHSENGSGASVDALIGDSLSTIAVEKVGYQWVESRKAAYGSIANAITGKTIPIKLAMPANPTTDPWILSSPAVAHDPADVNGDADIIASENGDYRKQQFAPQLNAFVRHASAFHNPQVMSIE